MKRMVHAGGEPSDELEQAYREWVERTVHIRGTPIRVVSKPGVPGYADPDPSRRLLAEHARVRPGEVVADFACGSGLVSAAAMLIGGAARVAASDRSAVAAAAAERTVAANGLDGVAVYSGQGSAPLPADFRAQLVTMRLVLDKASLIQLLWDAFHVLEPGGRLYLAGARDEGVKSAAKHVATLFGESQVAAYHSGHRVLVATKRSPAPLSLNGFDPAVLGHEFFRQFEATLAGESVTVLSRPGVFAWDHIDEATALLAETMLIPPGASVLDLGCGSGALGVVAARLSGTGQATLVDADAEAVRSALATVQANGCADRCEVLLSDVAGAVLSREFDVVVSNPPFHVGKGTELRVPRQFIVDAHKVLRPGGALFLVANRTLPYEGVVRRLFGNVRLARDERRFKVLTAVKDDS